MKTKSIVMLDDVNALLYDLMGTLDKEGQYQQATRLCDIMIELLNRSKVTMSEKDIEQEDGVLWIV